VKRSKQPVRPQPENIVDHSDMRSTLSKKLSELNTLHETMFEEHNRLIQENMKLTQDLIKLRLEKTQAITAKDEVNHVNG
jgi:regulator of replication initiation timing